MALPRSRAGARRRRLASVFLVGALAPAVLTACSDDTEEPADSADSGETADAGDAGTDAAETADAGGGAASDLDQAVSDLQTVLQITLPAATSFEIDGTTLTIGFSEGTAGGQAGDCLKVTGAAGGIGLTEYPIVLSYPDGSTEECGA